MTFECHLKDMKTPHNGLEQMAFQSEEEKAARGPNIC